MYTSVRLLGERGSGAPQGGREVPMTRERCKICVINRLCRVRHICGLALSATAALLRASALWVCVWDSGCCWSVEVAYALSRNCTRFDLLARCEV